MNIDEVASKCANTHGDDIVSPCIGLTSDALPDVLKPTMMENSDTEVSTQNALLETRSSLHFTFQTDNSHWYVLRTTYGREKKAYDFIINKGRTAFYPMITTIKLINSKCKAIEESCFPNNFFAYGTEEEIMSFVYDNVNLPFLLFYYRHFHCGNKIEKEPLFIPDNQNESFHIIVKVDTDDIIVSTNEVPKFQDGQMVRIIGGNFKGFIEHVACYQDQQRVEVIIDGMLTVATEYIPKAFIEIIINKTFLYDQFTERPAH